MPMRDSHHPYNRRQYYGEAVAERALEFLLATSTFWQRVAYHRKRRLAPHVVARIEAKEAHGRQRVSELVESLKAIFGKPFRGGTKKDSQHMHRCNKLLERYKVSWLLGPTWREKEPDPSCDESLKKATFGFVEIVIPGTKLSAHECHAARAVMELAELGALHKLKTCKRCRAWFFARFDHQLFCSKACQIKHNTSSAEWKEYKRNKAREYYHLHKLGKVKER